MFVIQTALVNPFRPGWRGGHMRTAGNTSACSAHFLFTDSRKGSRLLFMHIT